MNSRFVRGALLVLVAVLVSAVTTGAAGAGDRASVVSVKYLTSFGTLGRDAYAYVALERGYFRDAGFDVTILPGSGTTSNARLVASGSVEYGIADTTAMVLARGDGDLPVKCVSLIQQNILSAYLVRRSSGITSWKGFAGKTIGDIPGSSGTILFPFVAKKAGLDSSRVTFVPTTPQTGPGLLAAKRIDIYGQFVVGLPTVQAAVGVSDPLRAFTVTSVVPGLMGNCLMASDSRIAQKPDEVRRFTAALLRGLQWSIDNPGATGAILQKHVPLADYELAAKEVRIMKRFTRNKVTQVKGLGYMDPKRFDATASIVNNFFKPKNRVTRSEVYAPGFLPKKPIK